MPLKVWVPQMQDKYNYFHDLRNPNFCVGLMALLNNCDSLTTSNNP